MNTLASVALIAWALTLAFVVAPGMMAPDAAPAPPATVIDCDGMPKRPPVVVKPKVQE